MPYTHAWLPFQVPFTPQDIGFRWGAKRYDRRPANPTNSWEEKYRVLVQNSVDAPLAPRNSISCRCACLPVSSPPQRAFIALP